MRVLIIGGGLGGLCLAHGLKGAGIDVAVFERNSGPTDGLAGYGIHLNMTGWEALRICLPPAQFETLDKISTHAGSRLQFLDEKLHLLAQRNDADIPGSANAMRRGIGRIELRRILLDGLEDVVHFSKTFVRFERIDAGTVRAVFADGTFADGTVLVGADASHSKVRQQYLPKIHRLDLGVMTIAGRYMLTDESARLLPGYFADGTLNNIVPLAPDWMFVAAWSLDPDKGSGALGGSNFIVWAYVAARSSLPDNADKMTGAQLQPLVLDRVKAWHPAITTLVKQADIATIAPVALRSMPKLTRWPPSNITLLGDAIHNMTPMAGIGANTALKDAAVLTGVLTAAKASRKPISKAIGDYEAQMRTYANAAVSTSMRNSLNAVDGNMVKRFGFRTALKVAEAVPPVKKMMFKP